MSMYTISMQEQGKNNNKNSRTVLVSQPEGWADKMLLIGMWLCVHIIIPKMY